MSVTPRTYSADSVRRLFKETGVSVHTAAEAFALDEQELLAFMEGGAPRWLFPAVIAVALLSGDLTACEASRIAQSLTPDVDPAG